MMEDVVYVSVPYGPGGPPLGVQLAVLMKFSDVCDVTLDVIPVKAEAVWENQSRELHSRVRHSFNRAIARQENIEEVSEPSKSESLSAIGSRFKSHIPAAGEALDRRIARLISEPVTYGVVRDEKIDPYQINRAIDMDLIADAPARALMFSAQNAISVRKGVRGIMRVMSLGVAWGALAAVLGYRLGLVEIFSIGVNVALSGFFALVGGALCSLNSLFYTGKFLEEHDAQRYRRR